MVKITRTNINFEQKRDITSGITVSNVKTKRKASQVVIDDRPKVGCADHEAINYCSDCIGCYNDNNVAVKSITSCCEYPINKCVLNNNDTNFCITKGSYFGKPPNLTTAIFKDTICNSGQSCCDFFYDGQYRGDYDDNSKLGVCSEYNPTRLKEGQLGSRGSYDSLEAFQNAITNGVMCNCFSTSPKIKTLLNYGQTQKRLLYHRLEWPKKTTENLNYSYIYISEDIKNHPPNLYVYFRTCGYPKNLNALREPTTQILVSSAALKDNTYNNFYGETPKEITKNGNNFTIPNDVPENKEEFNNGLKAGSNIITISCANDKQIIYKVCVPHQTVPYENNMWKTEFFDCGVDVIPKPRSSFFLKNS